MIQLITLVPLFPLLGFLINGLLGKSVSKSFSGLIGCASVLISFVISLAAFFELNSSTVKLFHLSIFNWIQVGALNIPFSFEFDPLSALMLLIITGIGFLIHVYSTSYMKEDEGFQRYFAYLNLFVFFMLLLVLGSNYLVLFIGWEGVGLSSYLLIGFWFKTPSYNDAARKAFVMNRIGDLGFLLGIFLIFMRFRTLEFTGVFFELTTIHGTDNGLITAIAVLLFVGAAGKSAQIPLYTWLPDAMAGPTPVSALIHAATMVTAGVYMIARSNLLYLMAPDAMILIAIIGAATAFMAACIAITQNDIKKILAYSTVSQLGYMFLGLGVGAFNASFFHVITHAFFKALLFLGAGSVIHAMGGEQDIRKMGGLKGKLPLTWFTMLMATIAISGIPPFSGFFSKDEILSETFNSNKILWIVGVITALMTAFYMFRMMFITFYGSFRGTHDQEHHLHESPPSMTIPLIILAFLSVFGGVIGIPESIAQHANWLHNFLQPVFSAGQILIPAEAHTGSTEWILMGVSVAAALTGLAYAYSRYGRNQVPASDDAPRSALDNLSYHKFYIDELYNGMITVPLNYFSEVFYKVIDIKVIDGIVNGFGSAAAWLSGKLRLLQNGKTGSYVLMMVIGIVLLLILNIFNA